MKRILVFLSLLTAYFFISAQTNVDSLTVALNKPDISSAEQLALYNEICEYYLMSDHSMALSYARKGLFAAQKNKNSEMIAAFNEHIANLHYQSANWDSSIMYAQKALDYTQKTGDEERLIKLYLSMGALYGELSDYASSQEYFLKSLALAEKNGHKREQAKILGNLGGMYSFLGDYEQAAGYLEKTKLLSEELDDPLLLIHALYGLASIYLNSGSDVEKGLAYNLRVAAISDSIDNIQYQALSNQSLSMIYVHKYDFDKALEYAKKCLEAAERSGNPGILSGSWVVLSNIYLEQHQWKKSEEAALKAWNLDSVRLDYSPNIANNITISNIYMENIEKAISFFQKYKQLKNQSAERGFQETLTDMSVKYETEKKELRITALEQQKRLYIWLSIAGAVALLLAFGLLFYRHRMNIQKRKLAEQQKEMAEQQKELAEQQVKQLEQEKQLIATQAVLDGETAERARLARDLHDGLGGMLSAVKLNLKDMKGFAIIEGTDVERFSTALEMLDQSIGELRRVAHHMMPDSLMRYGLKVSLEDFCRAIPGANFQYFGEDPRLDNRLEVVIYRCAYELINNAVKHAQPQNINVQLIVDNGLVALTVQDDGEGFDPKTVENGTGLNNIRARISAYNGKMKIHSAPGKGTEIGIEIEQI